MESKYQMTISLNVLNHLGINLYSNIPAVISEIVANSWDADATIVDIKINSIDRSIEIQDNGEGMNYKDINGKYLTVGYQRRKDPERNVTTLQYGRHVMGRKGIGKLSVFSIADIVEVHIVKECEKNGFVMSAIKIKEIIDQQASDPSSKINYIPDAVPVERITIERGTKIILKELKKRLSKTEDFLKSRLSRRFSILGEKYNFNVNINGIPITIKDRDFYKKLEFIWYLGSESIYYADYAINAKKKIELPNKIQNGEKEYVIKGWIGTFDEHKNVDSDEENNTVVLLAHGKLIKEDVLRDFKEGRIFSKYLIGDIEADFLDDDFLDDIVTSDRQRIIESDDRWQILADFFEHQILKKIGNSWTLFRNEISEEKARENPAIDKWFQRLEGDNKKIAKKLFGKIESLKINDYDSKKELYKSSILAFEKLALKHNLGILNELDDIDNFVLLKKILSGIDEVEETYYYHITKGRIVVIEKFRQLTNAEVKEKVLQEYIFEHLWLLHPSWERAAFDAHIETTINKIFKKEFIDNAKLSKEEKLARFDIKYRTVADKNVIIELKKYNRSVKIYELIEQVDKYKRTLEKCLNQQFPESSKNIEIICILGKPPMPMDQDPTNRRLLAELNARYITYDTLIEESLKSYSDYLKSKQKISELIGIIEGI
jgi:hypothetical protein